MNLKGFKIHIGFLVALVVLPLFTSAAEDSCKSPLFFKKMMAQKQIAKDFQLGPNVDNVRQLTIHMNINAHGPDCGTPDSYGNELVVKMSIKSDHKKCNFQSVKISSTPWGDSLKSRKKDPREKYKNAIFSLDPFIEQDLNNPELEELTFRNSDLKQALLFTKDKYYFFQDVEKSSKLLPENGGTFNRLFQAAD